MSKLKIGALASGSGSNFQAIVNDLNQKVYRRGINYSLDKLKSFLSLLFNLSLISCLALL